MNVERAPRVNGAILGSAIAASTMAAAVQIFLGSSGQGTFFVFTGAAAIVGASVGGRRAPVVIRANRFPWEQVIGVAALAELLLGGAYVAFATIATLVAAPSYTVIVAVLGAVATVILLLMAFPIVFGASIVWALTLRASRNAP